MRVPLPFCYDNMQPNATALVAIVPCIATRRLGEPDQIVAGSAERVALY